MTPSLIPNRLERFGYGLLLMVVIIGLYISFTNESYFNSNFAAEDGIVEWLTFLLLLSSSILLYYKALKNWSNKPFTWKFGIIVLAFLFFFGAGEEVSWGQRIFNIESNGFFSEQNLQKETNLHNLTLGEININKLIFGKLIFVVILIYLLILPLIYKQYRCIKKTIDSWSIPIVNWHHVLAFTVCTIVVITIPSERKWEVYEFCFAFIFLMIFLKPKNIKIFKI